MEDAQHPEIIVVRRRGGHEEEHHGGAWKIAFADFMTAMMAFFLVLWIMSATDEQTKTLIARYFNPVKLEETSRTPKSIHGDGSTTPAVDAPDESPTPEPKQPGPNGAAKTLDNPPRPPPTAGYDKPDGNPPSASANLGDPASPKANMSEGALFADPYRSLDAIAGPTSPNVLAIMRRDAANGAPANDGLADPLRCWPRARPPPKPRRTSRRSRRRSKPRHRRQRRLPPLTTRPSRAYAAAKKSKPSAGVAARCRKSWSFRSRRRARRGWARPSTSRRPTKAC